MLKIFVKLFIFCELIVFAGMALYAEEIKDVEGGTIRLSLGYQSQSICENSKNNNNSKYSKYKRSACLQSGTLYYYYICEKTNNFCANVSGNLDLKAQNTGNTVLGVSESGNKYLANIPTKILPKVKQVIEKLKKLNITKLRNIELKLRKAAIKYKEKPGYLNLIKYLQFELRLIIESKQSITGVDSLFCELGTCDVKGGAVGNSSLAKQDTKANGYGFGSMKTLIGTYNGEKVTIVDRGGLGYRGYHTTLPTGVNGVGATYLFKARQWGGYTKPFDFDTIYAVRYSIKENANDKNTHLGQIGIGKNLGFTNTEMWGFVDLRNGEITISKIPGKIGNSEFKGKCSVKVDMSLSPVKRNTTFKFATQEWYDKRLANYNTTYGSRVINSKNIGETKITVINPGTAEMDRYIENLLKLEGYCLVPKGTDFYYNVRLDKNQGVNKACSQQKRACQDNGYCWDTKKSPCQLNMGYTVQTKYSYFEKGNPARKIRLGFEKYIETKYSHKDRERYGFEDGRRVSKGIYVTNNNKCIVPNLFTNSCICPAGYKVGTTSENSDGYYGQKGIATVKSCFRSDYTPAHGVCGPANGTTVSAEVPVTNACNSGRLLGGIRRISTSNGPEYSWKCRSTIDESIVYCNAKIDK